MIKVVVEDFFEETLVEKIENVFDAFSERLKEFSQIQATLEKEKKPKTFISPFYYLSLYAFYYFKRGFHAYVRCYKHLFEVVKYFIVNLCLSDYCACYLAEHALFGLGQSLVKNLFFLFCKKTEYSHIPNSLIKFQNGKEGLLRNLHVTNLFHTFLSLFLLFEQLAFT